MEGDRVKIVDSRVGNCWNREGRMDKYLGTVMTIKVVNGINISPNSYSVLMNEDHGRWVWSPHMIEGLVMETVEDILEDPSVWATGVDIDILLS